MDVQPLLRQRQSGVTMIEVLVAALILSFGITSIGMMMLATLKDSRSSLLRGRALSLAEDMVERIRNNSLGRPAYDTAVTTPVDMGCFQAGGTFAVACSPDDLAAHDLWHWKQLAESPSSGLPSSTAVVNTDQAQSPPLYTIRVQWLDGSVADGTIFSDSYELKVRL